jgi:hypothetical protein
MLRECLQSSSAGCYSFSCGIQNTLLELGSGDTDFIVPLWRAVTSGKHEYTYTVDPKLSGMDGLIERNM